MYRKVMKSMQGQTKVIAVAGKGGVGKTSLAAAMVKVLTKNTLIKEFLQLMQIQQSVCLQRLV